MDDLSRRCMEEIVQKTTGIEWVGVSLDDLFDPVPAQGLLGHAIDKCIEARAACLAYLRENPRVMPAWDRKQWWHAVCTNCGWQGPSIQLHGGGPMGDTGDYEDVRCPICEETTIEEVGA